MNEIMKMKTEMVSKLATMLLERNNNMTLEQALDEVFNSDTYRKLMDDNTHLYYQSAGYVFSFLEEELKIGKMA